MKMIQYIILFITAGLISCGDVDPIINPPPPPIETEIFELHWATRMDENKEIVGTDYTQHYRDWVLITGDIDDPFTIFAFNKNTGDKDWTFINDGIVNDEILISQIEGKTYLGIANKGIVGINLETQERIWEVYFQNLDYESRNGNIIYNGYLYHNFSVGGVGLDSEAAAIVRIDITTGTFEELYRKENDSDGLKTTSPPIVYTDSYGHEVMIFNERPNDGSPPNVKQELVSWDITDGKELWRTQDFTQFYASNGLHPPIIHNDIVITGGDWSIYAFDINTGQQLWRYQVPGYDKFGLWANTNHLIKNDRLYVNPTGHPIICLNPFDGSVIWENLEDAPNCTDNMIYYDKEDYLVYTSWGLGSVMIIDALTGELVHRERSEDSTFNNDPVYDPETDMFFTSTYKHAIGFKINRPE